VLGSTLIGGLGLSPAGKIYLDPSGGGGFIFTADPLITLFGQGPSGTLALGLHAGSPSGLVVLGGSAGWSQKFGPPKDPWIIGMNLRYDGAQDTWTAEGEAEMPKILPHVKVSAAARSGVIDRVGVTVEPGGKGVALGDTGFFFDSFSGEVAGLAKPPIKLTLGVTGGWGPMIPVVEKRPLSLEKAEVSVATDYSGEVKGKVGIVDRRVAGGDLDVSMHLQPFSASGQLNADVALLGTGYFAREAIAMTSTHFTASGGADFRVAGHRMTGANAIISDEGTGASGKACGVCPTVGVGIRWRNVLKFPPEPEWIGADIQRYRTVAAAAATSKPSQRTIDVARGTAVLAVYGDAKGTQAADLELLAPGGRRISLGHAGSLASVVRTADGRLAITVLQPAPGRWRLVQTAGAAVRVAKVPPLGTIVAGVPRPLGTKARPLPLHRIVVLSWRVIGHLPANAVASVQRAAAGAQGGVTIATTTARRGRLGIHTSLLAAGANRLSVILSSAGVPFRRINVAGTVYRR
jgi:hypothetical protein